MKYFRLALTTAAFAVSLSSGAAAQMMAKPPVPMSAQQFSNVGVGGSVQIAVRVDRLNRETVYGELLDHQTDSLAKATGKHVVLYLADGTPVVMGTASQVAPGAILYVYGIVTKPGHVDIKRVVIDTKYVKVE